LIKTLKDFQGNYENSNLNTENNQMPDKVLDFNEIQLPEINRKFKFNVKSIN
jgi:hypothetical protein